MLAGCGGFWAIASKYKHISFVSQHSAERQSRWSTLLGHPFPLESDQVQSIQVIEVVNISEPAKQEKQVSRESKGE